MSQDEIDRITESVERQLRERGFNELKDQVAALNMAIGRLATRQAHTEKLILLMNRRLQKVEVTDDKVDRALGFLGDLKRMLQVLVRDRGDDGPRS